MFKIDAEYLNEEIEAGGTTINKNGCYDGKIESFKIWKAKQSNAEGANITVVANNGKKMYLNITYKNRQGEDIDFTSKHLSHLSYLVNVGKPELMTDGTVPVYVGKSIGVVVTVGTKINEEDNREMYEHNLVGFYNPETRLTAYETLKKLPPMAVGKFEEMYKDAEPVVLNNKAEKKKEDDDPFGGFYTIDNDDIPF